LKFPCPPQPQQAFKVFKGRPQNPHMRFAALGPADGEVENAVALPFREDQKLSIEKPSVVLHG